MRPDVIVLDLGLPGGDGHAVLAALATEEPCPVVALLAGDADPARALAAELARPANACRGVVRDRFLASVAGRA